MNTKRYTVALTVFILMASITAGCIDFAAAQNGTKVNGIITSDTTWTKTDSPYTLSGNVLVSNGVTLNIEPGVSIYLGGYYLAVKGTLDARGSSSNPITFIGGVYGVGSIIFTQESSSWNSQTSSGCILEHVVASVNITGTSPKLTNSQLGLVNINGGSPTISDSVISEVDVFGGSPTISSNNFNVPLEDNSHGQINIYGGLPKILNNFINGTTTYRNNGDSRQPNLEQYFQPDFGILLCGVDANAEVLGNTISYHNRASINVISGSANISNNLITNSEDGISDRYSLPELHTHIAHITVNSNAITSNSFCAVANTYPTVKMALSQNNIYSNSQYSVYLGSSLVGSVNSNDINATNNWWGTTDQQAIKRSIYDYNQDCNLGEVNFTPVLTEPNPHATPNSNVALPTPDASTPPNTNTARPTVPATQNTMTTNKSDATNSLIPQEWTYAIIAVLSVAVVALSLALFAAKQKNKKLTKN